MVEEAGQAAAVRVATRAVALAKAAALVEATTGQEAATRTGAMEELEESGDNWEGTLLATLLQLALHTGGATGTWRQLRRRRGKVRQARGGGRGGRAVRWCKGHSQADSAQCT